MTEQRTSPEQRQELRDRHTLAPMPVCSICGEEMEIKAYEDRQVCWECQGCGIFSWTSDGDIAVLAAVDDADALEGALVEIARLRAACSDALAALRSGYRSPHPLDFYLGADPEMHDYVEGRDAARAAILLDDALAGVLEQGKKRGEG